MPLIFSFIFIWLMWRAGLFGGGDAKLLMGIVSLIPTFLGGVSFIPTFFLMVAIASFIHCFIFGVMEMVKDRKGMKTVAFALLPAAVGAGVYWITKGISCFSPILSVFSLAIVADIMTPLMHYRKEVPVSDSLEGEMLAETIGLKDGKLMRAMETSSLLLKIFSWHRHDMDLDEVIAAPNYLGISKGDIDKLKDFCTEVYIFPSYPMAPIILVALLLALLSGNLMPTG